MPMINMKMSREKMKEAEQPIEVEQPEYPYGLCLELSDETMEKLGITALPKVGTEMMLQAKVVVTSVRAYDRQGGDKEQSMSLQITDMDLGTSQAERNNSAATMLYGE